MNLTTLANIKTRVTAFGNTDAARDAALTALITSVSKRVEEFCYGRGGAFDSATVTEYRDGGDAMEIWVARPPIASVTSVHVSTAVPRVYDATTILVAGTDYDFDAAGHRIYHLGNGFTAGEKSVKLVYVGGFSSVPADLEQAVVDEILVKYHKGIGGLHHLLSVTQENGAISGIRFDDVPVSSLEVYRRYRTNIGVL